MLDSTDTDTDVNFCVDSKITIFALLPSDMYISVCFSPYYFQRYLYSAYLYILPF